MQDDQGAGALYVVATPIGNRADMTLRGLEVLRHVDKIAAEDTRVSRPLMEHYGIVAPLIALHQHNERQKSQLLIDELRAGRHIALISDAGTPAISDPGALLVEAVGQAGLRVVPVPGVSAVTTLLSVAGFAAATFHFHGFLPARRPERVRRLEALAELPGVQVFYEAPHRIQAALEDMVTVLGGTRRMVLGRELTKRFETLHRGTLQATLAWLEADPDQRRGEFVLALDEVALVPAADEDTDARWLPVLLAHLSLKDAVRIMVEMTGKGRGFWYERALALKDGAEVAR